MADRDPFMIVVGVDGSEQSLAALEWAITEARLRAGALRLVTAWYYPPLASAVGDGIIDGAFQKSAEAAHSAALKTVSDAGVTATGRVVESSPAAALLDAATGADLLVVGSRGRGGFAGLLLGSVSTHVAHHAECPVVIVRPKRA